MKNIRMPVIFMLIISVVLLSSCMQYSSFSELSNSITYNYQPGMLPNLNDTTTVIYVSPENPTENINQEQATVPSVPENTQAAPQQQEIPTSAIPVPAPVPAPEPVPENTTAPSSQTPDYSSYTKSQIIEAYQQALNTTRAYKGSYSATVTESFDANIKEAHPGGALTELLADNIIKLVGSEGQQTLNFSGGKAVNKDGESVPVLLPQRTSFSLPAEGVASANIEKTGDKLHIRIVLVPETVSMGQVPKYNSSSVGYLDTSSMDFKIVTISRVDISYTGSVIDAYIRADGYIESVTYTINMSTYAELSGMGITGYGTLEGAQTEKWVLNW